MISKGATGKGIKCSAGDLARIYSELKAQGAHNINLVTPMHFAPSVSESIRLAKINGLDIPVALNISGYDKKDTIRMFEGLADIFLTDFKFYSKELSRTVCGVSDYKEVALEALDEMVRICPSPVTGDDGILISGVIVRHLMLPGYLFDTRKILDLLLDRYDDNIIISLMDQYTPTEPVIDLCKKNRLPSGFAGRINKEHYAAMCDYLSLSGHPYCYMQEGDASGDAWIPEFRY